MQDVSILNALVVGALAGLGVFCGSWAIIVWRRRHRDVNAGPRSLSLRAAKALFAGGMLVGLLGLAYQETARRQGALQAGDVLTVRAPRDSLKLSHLTQEDQIRAGDVLARFEAPEREAGVEALRLKRQVLQVQRDALEYQPLELDAELVRQHQRALADLRQHRGSLDQLVPARDTIRRRQVEDRLEKNQRSRLVELELVARRNELVQAQANLAYLGHLDRSTQTMAQNLAATDIEAQKTQSERQTAEAQIAKLTGQVELLERELEQLARERAEYDALTDEQWQMLVREVERTHADLQQAAGEERQLAVRLEEDRQRALRQRQSRLREVDLEIEETQANLEGLQRTLTVRATFDGNVLYRVSAPHMAYNEAPLLIVGAEEGFVAHVRVPSREAAALARAGVVTLESTEAAVQRRFAGRVRAIRQLPGEDQYVVAELQCQPPDESILQLAREETVLLEMKWRPPLYSQPMLLVAGAMLLLAAVAGVVAAWRRTRHAEAGVAATQPAWAVAAKQPEPVVAGAELSPRTMAEHGSDATLLRGLGVRLRRALLEEEVSSDLLACVEWAMDRHHLRAIQLIRGGLQDGDVEMLSHHTHRLLEHLERQAETGEDGADEAQASRVRLCRVLRTLLPAVVATVEIGQGGNGHPGHTDWSYEYRDAE